jgi:hypothetical protein
MTPLTIPARMKCGCPGLAEVLLAHSKLTHTCARLGPHWPACVLSPPHWIPLKISGTWSMSLCAIRTL